MEHTNLPKVTTINETASEGNFSIEPLLPGYGSTLGNALRRVLLSSLEGAAVDFVQIEGIDHEFSTIENVKEDVIEIILNLKHLRFELATDAAELTLDKKGAGVVTAADFKANSDCKILNHDQVIATLSEGAHLVMRIGVKHGIGYEPVERKADREKAVGMISIDSIFSPVTAVSYNMENTRVGQMTNYDRLLISVKTDGSIKPMDALQKSARILADHYHVIAGEEPSSNSDFEKPAEEELVSTEEIIVKEDEVEILHSLDAKTKIEDAGLSGRTVHSLSTAGYKTLAGLKRLSDIKLQGIKGLGTKGVEEVKAVLSRVN